MARSFRTIAAAAALLALAAVHPGAQQQPAQPQNAPPGAAQQAVPPAPPPSAPDASQQPPVFRTGINFVRVDAIVTDKNGNPVADLQPSDFEVTEDGKPQKIATFKLIHLDGAAQQASAEAPKAIRSDYDEESEAARDDVRLFAIFLDDYHVKKGTSLSVRNPLTRFIDTQILPSDMVAVMYPLEPTSSVQFTRDHGAIMKALQQFVGRKYDYTPRNEFEERYADYPTETVEQIRNQVSLSAITGLIIHMGSLKQGRKALILVSEGFTNMLPPQMRNLDAQMPGSGNPNAFNPLAGLDDPNEQRAQFFASMDLETDLREVYDAANKNNVAIYPVDPRGLPGFEFDIDQAVNNETDSQYLDSTMNTLRELAENTDGRAIVNRNDLDVGMKQIMRDSSAYYLIGYNSAAAPTDGKFHEIKVRLKRPGLQVRARKGYWALTTQEAKAATAPPKPALPKPVQAAIESAIARPSSAAVIRSWIGTSRGENGKTRVTFVWEPMPKAAGGRPASADEAPARVSLMAATADGAPVFRGKVPDPGAQPEAAGRSTGAPAGNGTNGTNGLHAPGAAAPSTLERVTFDAPPGKLELRVSVEGSDAQVLDTEMRDITVPDLTAPQAALGTPEVLRARTAREYQQLKGDPDAVPRPEREFSRTDRLLIRVPAYGPGGAAPPLSVHLLNRSGQAMTELQAAPSPKPDEAQIDLPLASLPPGEYVVEIKTGGSDGLTELVAFRVTG